MLQEPTRMATDGFGYGYPRKNEACVMCENGTPAICRAIETGEGLCLHHKENNDEARLRK